MQQRRGLRSPFLFAAWQDVRSGNAYPPQTSMPGPRFFLTVILIMKWLITLLALVAASLAGAKEPSLEQQRKIMFFGHDDRVTVISPFTGPYTAIGVMQTAGGYDCSATLVSPDTAITAAHCFWMTGKTMDHGVWFKTAYDRESYTAHYRVVGQVFNKNFRKGVLYKKDGLYITEASRPYDIAVIKLELVDGKPPQPMATFDGTREQLQQLLKNAKYTVSQAGYPEDQDNQLAAHRNCKVTGLSRDNTIFHRCDTLEGDSGSPVWVDTAKGPLLIAIQSSAPTYDARDDVDNIAVTLLQRPVLVPSAH